MDWNSNLRFRLRDAQNRIARLRESHTRLAEDIYNRFIELDMAIDQLQNFYNGESNEQTPEKLQRRNHRNIAEADVNKISRPISSSAVNFLQNREYGAFMGARTQASGLRFKQKDLPDFVSQQLPALLMEIEFSLGIVNKVFASQWLNDSHVVMGTKCNKLLVLDVHTKNLVHIQSIRSSADSEPAKCPCGIHGISINPSKTLLATGGENTNDLAVYELPTFDPLCIGEGAHGDWIFDMEWVDDKHIITGSRDGSVALWHIDSDKLSSRSNSDSFPPCPPTITNCRQQKCEQADKVRALAISHSKALLGTLSMNAKFHFWDIETFTQLDSITLPWKRENVCVANSDDLNLFVVGSQAFVTTIDHRDRTKNGFIPIRSSDGDRAGIRSVSFNNNMVTIGTGNAHVLFYDLRNKKFLHNANGIDCRLTVGQGWLREDYNYREHFFQGSYPNAIYTHCYDEDKTRLFVAGGPLPSGLYGNYAGLFY